MTKSVKDPRLRTTSPVPTESTKKHITSPDLNIHNTAKLSPKGPKKGKALSVVNKIVNNLAGKKPKPSKKTYSMREPPNNIDQPVKNWDGTVQSSKRKATSSSKEKDIFTATKEPSLSKQKKEAVADKPNTEVQASHESGQTPPPPFSADFSGLSTKDMQIAAQAAAIATAMHQMQSVVKGPIAPEQSAQLAAQFIKMLQSSSQETLTSTVVTMSNEAKQSSTHITNSTSTVSTSTATSSSSVKVEKSIKNKNEQPKSDTTSQNKSKKVSESTISKTTKPTPSIAKVDAKAENKTETADATKNLSKGNKIGDKNKDRKGQNTKYEPPSKRPKDSSESTERPRKARARSPSRYYCKLEQKLGTEKQVEENEKKMNLQRERKLSESDENLDEKAREQKKVYQSYVSHIEVLEKQFKQPNSKISVKTLESVFKQFEGKYKKRMLSNEQYNLLADRLDKFASTITGTDTKVTKRIAQHENNNENKNEPRTRDTRPPPFRNDIRPMIGPDGRPLGPDGPFPPHGFMPRGRGSRFMRQPPQHWRGPPPGHFPERFPPHFRNGPPPHMMEGPPLRPPLDPMGRPPFPPMERDGMVAAHQMGMHRPPNGMEMPPQPYPEMHTQQFHDRALQQPFSDMPQKQFPDMASHGHGQPMPQPHWDGPPMDFPQWRESPQPHMMPDGHQPMQHMEGPPGPGLMPVGQMPLPHRNSPIPGFSENSQPLPESDTPGL